VEREIALIWTDPEYLGLFERNALIPEALAAE
jgi:hypothetical protein